MINVFSTILSFLVLERKKSKIFFSEFLYFFYYCY